MHVVDDQKGYSHHLLGRLRYLGKTTTCTSNFISNIAKNKSSR